MTEEQELQKELQKIVSLHNPLEKLYTVVALILIAIVCITIVCTIGEFWFILIVFAGGFIFVKLGFSLKSDHIPQTKLAYSACCLMESLIDLKTACDDLSPTRKYISAIGPGSHQELYSKFISLYPELASQKLYSLASVKLDYADIG